MVTYKPAGELQEPHVQNSAHTSFLIPPKKLVRLNEYVMPNRVSKDKWIFSTANVSIGLIMSRTGRLIDSVLPPQSLQSLRSHDLVFKW